MSMTTDTDLTRACAKMMGVNVVEQNPPGLLGRNESFWLLPGWRERYAPLDNPEQNDALDKVLLARGTYAVSKEFFRYDDSDNIIFSRYGNMLDPAVKRRARVECVAKLAEGK